jgi:hypothetical protein
MQKLVFLSEKDMIDQHEKGFNFNFVRLDYGPYSPELEADRKKLVYLGYLVDGKLLPTSETKSLIDDFQDVIDRNPAFVEKIRNVNLKYGGMTADQLKVFIHCMEWGHGKTIHDLDLTTPMLYPLNPSKARLSFQITDKEIDDLAMNLDLEACTGLEQANDDMQRGRLMTHEQVFASLH